METTETIVQEERVPRHKVQTVWNPVMVVPLTFVLAAELIHGHHRLACAVLLLVYLDHPALGVRDALATIPNLAGWTPWRVAGLILGGPLVAGALAPLVLPGSALLALKVLAAAWFVVGGLGRCRAWWRGKVQWMDMVTLCGFDIAAGVSYAAELMLGGR